MSDSAETTLAGPPTLNHLIGQKRPVQQLRTAIEAVINDRAASSSGSPAPALGHVLIVGPPGVGKSTISNIIARELGVSAFEELAQNLLTPSQLQGLFLLPDEGDVVFLDEIHELQPIVQTTLYRALEDRRLFLQSGKGRERNAVTLPPFTFIGATTDEYRLSKPLRDRFKLVVRLSYYSDDEIQALLQQRTRRLEWGIEPAALAELANKGRGTPRIAIRLLEAARRVCRAEGESTITLAHVYRMMEIEGVDSLGLDELEQRYLRILATSSEPIRLNVLATMVGLPRRTLEVVVESDLLRLGLISKEDDGRMLTPRGRDHLSVSAVRSDQHLGA